MVKIDGKLHLIIRAEDDGDDFDIVAEADLVGTMLHGLDITIQGQKHHFGPHVSTGGDLLRDLALVVQELATEVRAQTGTYTCASEFDPEIPFA
jgi:hypothetical protein